MIKEVSVLSGKKAADIPCTITVDETNFLHEWNKDDQTQSCLGGFMLFARKNRIVCSQTLDDRMALVFAQAIPQMRVTLFPSLRKPEKAPVQGH